MLDILNNIPGVKIVCSTLYFNYYLKLKFVLVFLLNFNIMLLKRFYSNIEVRVYSEVILSTMKGNNISNLLFLYIEIYVSII